ncbi:glycosyltransferase [Flavobacterium sp. GB2R13]|uniref:glycosyltransferase n=1 Tax=Flavobacterium algoris TaxID=3398733 RepID=UPI003A87ED41
MISITVSVFILTYNQEQFIAQTIESILMQKTNFSFQLVIGEDCSTDATRVICEKYAIDYGDKIKLLPSQGKNIGLIANYIRTIKACDGNYIAICDGDDYWIDEHKLQKQVDFLESNPEYSIVHTAVKMEYPNGDCEFFYNDNCLKLNDFNSLIHFNFIVSVTVLFRNIQSIEPLPLWVIKYPYGDWSTYLWTIRKGGKIHYIPDVTAVYRKNIGVSSGLIGSYLLDLGILEDMCNDINFNKYKPYLSSCLFEKQCDYLFKLNNRKEYKESFFLFVHLIRTKSRKFYVAKRYLHSLINNILSFFKKNIIKKDMSKT